MTNKKKIGFWRCRHCQKGYPSPTQAEMCYTLDMQEEILNIQMSIGKKSCTPIRRNGSKVK